MEKKSNSGLNKIEVYLVKEVWRWLHGVLRNPHFNVSLPSSNCLTFTPKVTSWFKMSAEAPAIMSQLQAGGRKRSGRAKECLSQVRSILSIFSRSSILYSHTVIHTIMAPQRCPCPNPRNCEYLPYVAKRTLQVRLN